jgi:hypothetical protein
MIPFSSAIPQEQFRDSRKRTIGDSKEQDFNQRLPDAANMTRRRSQGFVSS